MKRVFSGGEIDWELLYNKNSQRRISLPTYPFAREGYWIPAGNTSVSGYNQQEVLRKLHPMIDRNTSTLEEQKFTTVFSGKEFYLSDHVIAGDKILPGVTYIEMARAASELSGLDHIQKIKDIVWIRPIKIEECSREIQICLYPNQNNVGYEISSINEDGTKLLHGQGKMLIGMENTFYNNEEPINLESIKQRCTNHISKEAYYNRYIEAGYEYGKSLQSMEEIYVGKGEALALLIFPAGVNTQLQDIRLHPSLMDGAFQTIAALVDERDATAYLPFALGEIEIIRNLKEKCYAYTTLVSETFNIKKYNIDVVDEEGMLLLRFKDFSLRGVQMIHQADVAAQSETLYYSCHWEQRALIEVEEKVTLESILLFDQDENLYKVLKETHRERKITLVKVGASYKEVSDDEYEINPANHEDYVKMLKSLEKKKNIPTHILHLWNIQKCEQIDLGAYSVYHLSRALVEQKLNKHLKFVFGYSVEGEKGYSHHEAVGSLLKTVCLETTKIGYKTIGFNTKRTIDILDILLSELKAEDKEIKYQDGQRLVKYIYEIEEIENTEKEHKSLIKHKGVYLITGGAGGLGQIFAEHLAKVYHARLVLVGRSELTKEKQLKIDLLKKYGAEVIYIEADISKKEEVDQLITKAKVEYKEINGIIHSAGVIRDSYLINKSEEEMTAVLDPKVYGTLWLDEATKDEPLDFFVMFSSITAVLGNAGQTDYAYANSFMDSYANYREKLKQQVERQGKSISINWPLWREGGMKVDQQTEILIEKNFGLKLFETEIGIDTFELSLLQSATQFIVLQGDRKKINNAIKKNQEKVIIETETIEILEADEKNILEKLQEDLKQIIAGILKLQISDIDLDEDMSGFGFDSISFTEFSNALNDKYLIDIMPSIFYEHTTIISLIEYLLETYKVKFGNYFGKKVKKVDHQEVLNKVEEIPVIETKSRLRFNNYPVSRVIPHIEHMKEPVAIVGLSCVMPGSENHREFWNNIENEKDLITEIPRDRWDWKAYYGDPINEANKTNIKWGGFIRDIDKFDPLFFGISPREAALMDPQHRIFIENVWRAIEDAGYKASDLAGTRTGVFIGAGACDYSYLLKESGIDLHAQITTGTSFSIMANRVSYQLDLRGPSEIIDTACSSSLVALHRAVEAIQKDGCEMAFAGGINALLNPETFITLSKAGMLSEDGRCKTFDKRANGYVRGEGCGVLLLKPLSKAIKDHDTIYAVIKGCAVNHGGHANTMTTPNPNAQAELIVSAWEESKIDPTTIGYIEAHGTGTSLGDPIEINGLKKAFEQLCKNSDIATLDRAYCGIGSVKTNIGHLEFGAGIAGVIKVILAMKNKKIPASIHFEEQNPYIKLEESPFYIVDKTIQWEALKDDNNNLVPRRGGVSSFGFGGVNAHIALEEYLVPTATVAEESIKPQMIILSAKSEERLKAYAKDLIEYIDQQQVMEAQEPQHSTNISDIAYTLQVGREEMDVRMAIIASHLSELRDKLTSYYRDEENADLFIGNVKNNKDKINLLITGEKGKNYIKSIVEDGELRQIAKLWISGIKIEWSSPDQENNRKRISLPTYPFAKESYWVPERDKSEGNNNQCQLISKLHPMIDRNTSTLEEQRFTTVFSGKEFFLSDHIIEGSKILPGVTYIEMARAASELSGMNHIRKIKDIVWIRPMIIDEVSREVHIYLYPNQDNVEYEIGTINEEGTYLLHGQGKMRIGIENTFNTNDEPINLESIKQRCTNHISKEAYYNRYIEAGYEYGKSLQSMEELYVGKGEALALLIFPAGVNTQLQDIRLHPSLMDGAFQTIAALVDEGDATAYLPFALGEIEIIRDFKEKCYAYTTLVSEKINIKKYNIDVVDEEGMLLVRFKDFSLRGIQTVDQVAIAVQSETLYYSSQWEQKEFIDVEQQKVELRSILLFDTEEGLYKAIKETDRESEVTLVKVGASYKVVSEDEYEINPSNHNDYIKLVQALKEKKRIPSVILHFWSKDNTKFIEERNTEPEHLEKELMTSVYSVYHLSGSLLKEKIDTPIQIVYAYSVNGLKGHSHYEAVGSLLKTICFETSKIGYKTIGFNLTNAEGEYPLTTEIAVDILDILLSELKSEDKEVIYQEGHRSVKVISAIDNIEKNQSEIPLIKDKGVYIITGGAGGLGFIFAEHLAKVYQARLVLVGRSDLTKDKQSQIDLLKGYGAQVAYVKADISKKEDADELITKAKDEYKEINGIIHSAGVIRDSYLINKTEEELTAVFAPKVYGTQWLDEATKDEPLDFFAMFSSITSVLGNAGQTDYAYANGFMDSYAIYREKMKQHKKRQGKSISINWPLWREGGMKVDQQTEILLEKNFGLKLFETEIGIDTFELSLLQPVSQLIVLQGDKRKINNTIKRNQEKAVKETETIEILEADEKNILEKLQGDLKQIIAEILKLQISDIDLDEDMSGFGFDSISFTEFSNALNNKYLIDIMPSVFYEHTTLISLIKYLLDTYKGILGNYFGEKVIRVSHQEVSNKVEEIPVIETKGRTRFNNYPVSRVIPHIEHSKEPVAIVGLSCVMPGSENYQEFWNNIENEKDLITEIPSDRWDWKAYYGDPINEANKTNIKWGGFMKDIDKFDPLFFGISPREAALMDPQHRIFIENVWRAVEDAGYKASDLAGTRTGVFIGAGACEYRYLLKESGIDLHAQISTGTAFSIMANRISYQLDLRGPSEVIDTACSSSLVAIHRAVEAIQRDGCEMAFAGGINALFSPENFITFSKAGMLSQDGRCKTFDKSANGYVRGEGCGVVLLKPLSKAIKDHDTIYAVIKGCAVNHGGHANTMTTPNPNAQAELIVSAWEESNIDPTTIGYIEAHGTGTSLGDPIEINGLKKAFEQLYKNSEITMPDRPYCGIGSVKTNIGHLEFGAGIAGVIKIILAMKNKKIPASIHFEEQNPYIKLEDSPFYIVDKTIQWEAFKDDRNNWIPRRGGVSSFGFGGVNAHLALEEYLAPTAAIVEESAQPQIIILSAKSEDRLKAYAKDLIEFLDHQLVIEDQEPQHCVKVSDIAYTLQVGREEMDVRMAIIASHLLELRDKLTSYYRDEENADLFIGNVKNNKDKINLLITGEKGKKYIKSVVEDGELRQIAGLWISGVKIEWSSSDKGNHSKRIALPTYPFARESHWFTDLPSGKKSKTAIVSETNDLHPLISKNTSDFYEQKFTTILDENQFYLADHVVAGQKMLPGVASIEMAYIAGKLSGKRNISKIQDIIWIRPIIVLEKLKEVNISLSTKGDVIDYAIQSINEDNSRTLYSQGKLRMDLKDIQPIHTYIDIGAIKEQCQVLIDSQQCYSKFRESGLEYGSSFRTIKEIYSGDNEALTALQLPSDLIEDFNKFELHPSLMDGALQSVIGIKNSGLEGEGVHLPIGIEEIEIFHPLSIQCYIYAKTVKDFEKAEGRSKKYTIEIVDTNGLVLVRMKEFMVRPLHKTVSEEQNSFNVTKYDNTDLLNKVQEKLKRILSEEINMPITRIDAYEPFEKYGIDSIMIMSLNGVLETHFGNISKTLLFEYKNLRELAEYFAKNHSEKFEEGMGSTEEMIPKEINPVTEVKTNIPLRSNSERFVRSEQIMNKSEIAEDDIAIIGVSGRYPMADTLDEFWENLKVGKDCITEVPKERWNHDAYYDADKNKKGKSYSKWGGFINDVDKFDPMFFNISPKEAEIMDPQERLFLQTVWHTIEDAGYTKLRLEQYKVGVFAGVMYNHYPMYAAEESMKGNVIAVNSTYASIANRVSYYFNLNGPSISLDTMCSSSLTAIHLACESIKRGECDAALAGGVNVTIHPNKYIMLSQGRFASSDGRCRSFGEGGDGYVPGEGVGTVLLKPLKKAILDGDRIYSVIKGTAMNHGGKTNGYAVPNPKAQSTLISEALIKAKVNPRTISYIEAHGTGTSLGDPIEIAGLQKAFEAYTQDAQFCSIGSSKSNIGHLESAAGIAAITKVILQMKYKTLVPSIHSENMNPNINFETSPFYIQHELKEWKAPIIDGQNYPRCAGISSFGAGGSNAHIIMEEYIDSISQPRVTVREKELILLSARDEDRLKEYALRLSTYLEKIEAYEKPSLSGIAYTLQTGREAMEERLALIVSNIEELREKLLGFIRSDKHMEAVYRGSIKTRINHEDLFDTVKQENNRKLFELKQYEKLAQEWTVGEAIDWRTLYRDEMNKVLSLPVYPFAREYYWIPGQGENNLNSDAKQQTAATLHHLVGKNTSTLNEQCFETVFNGNEFFFKDHVVAGRKIMPAAAFIEMARAAGDLSENMKVCKMKDMIWVKPITMDNISKLIQINLIPEIGFVEYEIVETLENDIKTIYSKGRLIYGELTLDEMDEVFFDIESIKGRSTEVISRQQCYTAFDEIDIQYGNRFRVIQEMYVGKGQALAKLKLQEKDDLDEFVLHPTILDGMFQSVLGVGYGQSAKQLYIPFTIGELSIYGPLSYRGYSYAVSKNNGRLESDIKVFDIYLLDEAGKVVLKVSDFSVKPMIKRVSHPANSMEGVELIDLLNKVYLGETEVDSVIEFIEGKEGMENA
ncbi:MAG: hypothetical protein CVU84_08530 [Firmicutes bacterium HGW-Firmicutes-1]|nr:MAG: hypothetical protein CVU84_08530 [Firmicutes bacterium HGW-Firmicutes-1]